MTTQTPEWTATWRIGLLGGLRIDVDGTTVASLENRKTDLLLTYLALHREQPLLRSDVAQNLWSDRSPELARSRLGEVLFLLRRELQGLGAPPGFIRSGRRFIELARAVETDVEEFAGQVGSALATSDAAVRQHFLQRAAALYRGHLVPHIDEVWAQTHRDRYSALYEVIVRELQTAPASPSDAVADQLQIATDPHEVVRLVGAGARAGHATGTAASFVGDTPIWESDISVRDLRREHAERLVDLVEEAETNLTGPSRASWLDRLESERENIMAALEWAARTGEHTLALRIAGPLWRFWYERGPLDEGCRELERALLPLALGTSAVVAKANHGAGALALKAGYLELARERFEKALDLWRRLDEPVNLALSLNNIALVHQKEGDYEKARAKLREARAIVRRLGDGPLLAIVLKDSAQVEIQLQDLDKAEELLNERLHLAEGSRNRRVVGDTLGQLASLAQHRGDWDTAERLFSRALAQAQEDNDLRAIGYCLRGLGYNAYSSGYYEAALSHFESSADIARSLGDIRNLGESLRYVAAAHSAAGRTEAAIAAYRLAHEMLVHVGEAHGIARIEAALAELGAGPD